MQRRREGEAERGPAARAAVQTGTLRSPEPGTVVCSGAIGDHGFANARGTIVFSGTFGDGPVSAASGGATCTHNDGYIDAKLTLPVEDGEVTLLAEDAYWLRSAMAVIKSAGFLGQAPMTLEAVINHRDGSCTAQSPIFVAGFTGVMAAAGRMTYGFDPGA